MKEKIKKPLLFVLALLPIAIVGGYFTGVYGYVELTEDIKAQIMEQTGNNVILVYISTALQTVIYTIICGFVGYILASSLGLMRPLKFERKQVLTTLVWTLFIGLVVSTDIFLFRFEIPQVADMYREKPSLAYWISSVTYGGVIEEVMMRLFLMSLISFAIWKIIFRKAKQVPTGVLICANIIAALLFAAGHLPATVQMFGEITPLLLFRCFLLNGAGGLAFGYLYRKCGIHYSMMAHAGAHIVWKLIWIVTFGDGGSGPLY